jgi:hypothetical protein
MQIENGVVPQTKASRLWMALGGLLAALLAVPFLASGLLDLGDESLTDLVIGLAACWLAARLWLTAAGRSLRMRRPLPALGAAVR